MQSSDGSQPSHTTMPQQGQSNPVSNAQQLLVNALLEENERLKLELAQSDNECASLQLQLSRANMLVELYSNPQAAAGDAARRITELPIEQAVRKDRKPRHCTCCGQSHADSRTCGRSHTCLINKCVESL